MVDSVQASLIALLKDFTEEWGVDHEIGPRSFIVKDLEFESIDIIQMIVAIEQQYRRRDFGFDALLMRDGRYIDDLSVEQISTFVAARLAPANQTN